MSITIKQLEIICIVGILAHERKFPQKIELDIELELDLTAFLISQELKDSANYAEIGTFLTEWICEARFELLETLAIQSCDVILEKWSCITQSKITVKKPSAIPNAKYASVTVERKRSERNSELSSFKN